MDIMKAKSLNITKLLKEKELAEKHKKLANQWKHCSIGEDHCNLYVDHAEKYEKMRENLIEWIVEAEKRCRSRLLNVEDIEGAINDLNEKLKACTNTGLNGAECWIDTNNQVFPKTYYSKSHSKKPESTQFLVVRKNKNWIITCIDRMIVSNKRFDLRLPEKAKAEILASFEKFNY